MTPAQPLEAELAPYIAAQVSALRQRVAAGNAPGNLDGLLARYILNDLINFPWDVDPMSGAWLKDNTHRLEDSGALAVLGYGLTLSTSISTDLMSTVRSGLARLAQRDPFPGDRISFLHDTRVLLGVCLAADAISAESPDVNLWLRRTLTDPRRQPSDLFHDLAQGYARVVLGDSAVALPSLQTMTHVAELAMAYWMMAQGTAVFTDNRNDAGVLQVRVMSAALQTDPSDLPVPQAALVLWTITNVVNSTIDQMVLSRSHVGLALRRFEAAMRRWRWDDQSLKRPIRWEITSEREVQDILWIILRSTFDDVVDEDTLPKFGHSSYRADFGLPRLGILVEAKYATSAADFKRIQTEVIVDSVAYLKISDRYKEIIVFIYDESSSVEQHEVTRTALLSLAGISDVVIVCRPGMLPAPNRTPATGSRANKNASVRRRTS